jgi:hypothetical protein
LFGIAVWFDQASTMLPNRKDRRTQSIPVPLNDVPENHWTQKSRIVFALSRSLANHIRWNLHQKVDLWQDATNSLTFDCVA